MFGDVINVCISLENLTDLDFLLTLLYRVVGKIEPYII